VFLDVPEIEIVQVCGAKRLGEKSEEGANKILPDDLFLGKITAFDLHPLVADFLNLGSDIDGLALNSDRVRKYRATYFEEELFAMRRIPGVEGHTLVLQTVPLDVRVSNGSVVVDNQVGNVGLFEFHLGVRDLAVNHCSHFY